MLGVPRSLLKEVLVSAEEHIRSVAGTVIERRVARVPEGPRKTLVFYGVRRSGKTFILYDLFLRHADQALYVDFEDDRLADFSLRDFDALREVFFELKPRGAHARPWFLLDEVQNVAGWEKFCRRAAEREGIRVVVSGSSSRIAPREIATELRGRSWSAEVLPFSFAEYLQARGMDPGDRALPFGSRKATVARHFADFLRWGGFPEVALLERAHDRAKLLREYLSAMFFRDLVERYSISNIPLLDALAERLFSSFATKASLTSIHREFQDRFRFSKDSLFAYYRHFVDSMLVFEVRMLAESAARRMRNPPKIYLVDTGLCRRVTSADSGRLLENAVHVELRRRGFEPFYFQGERECDFVVRDAQGGMMPIQVCLELDAANRERELGGLKEACRHVGAREGTILTMSEQAEFREDGIVVRVEPAWRWCLGGGA